MSFMRLQKKIDEMRSPVAVGLDPALENIPQQILEKYFANQGETPEAASLAVIDFNINLISGLCDIVPAIKAQSAFYEMLGVYGATALKFTCDFAREKGMYVIIDGKRGDIGLTAEAYSAAYLGAVKIGSTEHMPYNADALTINAYLGSDGIRPFLDTAALFDKAVFALVKTSNPSAGELQDRTLAQAGDGPGSTLYTAVGDLLEKISGDSTDEYGYTRAGAVVGATYPDEMRFLRERLRHTFFLIPGYGAQGGSAEDAALGFGKDGHGAIVNSSRAIIAAWKKSGTDRYVDAAREEAVKMRDELRWALGKC